MSPEQYEAASLDGAGTFRKFTNVTLPAIRPVTAFVVVTSFISAAQLFDEPYLLTKGGPGEATLSVAMFIYRAAFERQQFGYAAAGCRAVRRRVRRQSDPQPRARHREGRRMTATTVTEAVTTRGAGRRPVPVRHAPRAGSPPRPPLRHVDRVLLVFVFPLLWALSGSFKRRGDIFSTPPTLIRVRRPARTT